MLHEMGHDTGIDLAALVAARPRGAAGARPAARQPRAHRGAGRLAESDRERRRASPRRGDARGHGARLRRRRASAPRPSGRRIACASSAPTRSASSRTATRAPSRYAQGAHFARGALAALPWAAAAGGRRAGVVRARLQRAGPVARAPLLPAGEGANAIGTTAGARTSAPARWCSWRTTTPPSTGLMWDPRMLAAGDAAAERTGKRASLALLPELALLGAVVGGPSAAPGGGGGPGHRGGADGRPGAEPHRARRERQRERRGGGARRGRAPGARPARRPRGGGAPVRLRGVRDGRHGAPGCAAEGQALDSATTLVLGLDTVGSGEPVVLEAEGGLWPVRYREEDVAFAERAARHRRRAPAALAARRLDGPRAGPAGRPSRRSRSCPCGRAASPTITCRRTRPSRWTTAVSRPA